MNKRLIINNSQKVFNISLESIKEREEYIEVVPSNYAEIKQELRKLADDTDDFIIRNDKKYLIYQTPTIDDELVGLLFDYGEEVVYYTNTIAPTHIIEKVARNRYTSSIMYSSLSPISYERAENIQEASTAGQVSLDVYLTGDMTPFDVIVSLSKVRYAVDKVYIDFNRDVYDTYEKEYKFFNELRDPMSAWKMNIIINYATEEEKDYLEEQAAIDRKKRVISTTWEQH